MNDLWDSLCAEGLLHALEEAKNSGLLEQLNVVSNRDATQAYTVLYLSDMKLMQMLREIALDGAHYRAANLDRLFSQLEACDNVEDHDKLQRDIYIVTHMSELECVINLPKFLRLCLEAQQRNYELSDFFYNRPQ